MTPTLIREDEKLWGMVYPPLLEIGNAPELISIFLSGIQMILLSKAFSLLITVSASFFDSTILKGKGLFIAKIEFDAV